MKNISIAVVGIILFIFGLTLFGKLAEGKKLAESQDTEKTAFAAIEGPPFCTWTVKDPERVMSENTSQAILVEFTNLADVNCESTLSLRAPGFDISPSKEEQSIALNAGATGSLSWITIPRKTGTYKITLSDMIQTRIFGITVTNVFGLSAIQAKFASILGTILGPMFTVPWWWDRLRQHKSKKKEQNNTSSTTSS